MGKKALKGVMEYKEYIDQIDDPKTREWIKQFYNEYHGGNPTQYENSILETQEQISEAYRNYNALYKDAFAVSKMLDNQKEITDDEREIYELAADETEWETAYMQIGPEAATEVIFQQTIRDLKTSLDKKVVLSRFYVKMNKLTKEIRKEKRKQR